MTLVSATHVGKWAKHHKAS